MKKFVTNDIFKTLSESSEELKIQTFVVGGWVRDSLLKRNLKYGDIDIVCNEKAIELAKKIAKKLKIKEVIIYKNFGTALVKHKTWKIEFISARTEFYNIDSRKASHQTWGQWKMIKKEEILQ